MDERSRMILVVVVGTLLFLAMVGLMGLLMVVNTNRRHRYRADLAEAELRREREVQRAQREATEQTLAEVGRELHDNVGQLLTVVQMGLRSMDNGDPRSGSTMEVLDRSIEEVRRLGRTLNTELWKQRSLLEALEEEAQRIERLGTTRVELLVEGDPLDPPDDAKTILFRTCQEILNNTMRHSKADRIMIAVSGYSKLQVSVTDNGKGFELATVRSGGGLQNIRHRCELIGYRATLKSSPGNGCSWTLEPVS